MIIDTHSHLHFEDFENIENEIKIMEDNGVIKSILIGSDFESTEKALNLAKKYDYFKVVAGISHPIESPLVEDLEVEIKKVEKQVLENKDLIVGIGEVGLDYYHINQEKVEEEKIIQKQVFEENIVLAKKYNLPLIVHIRDAWDDAYEILKNNFPHDKGELKGVEKNDLELNQYEINPPTPLVRGAGDEAFIKGIGKKNINIVIHCFTGNPEIVDKFLSLGESIYIGFSGIVTFKNAIDIQNSVTKVPLDRILVETDAPYLAPTPYRGKLNTSGYTKFVLDKIKELRDENPEIIENQIYENSLRFYGIN